MRPAVAVLLAALAAGPVRAQSDADWQKLVAAAKVEGRVVVYNSALGAPNYKAAVDAFQRRYGIEVQTLDSRVAEMNERIQAEQTGGHYIGDLEQNTNTYTLGHDRQGWLQPHGSLPNLAALRPDLPADPDNVPCFVQGFGLFYNTDLVAAAQAPRGWRDLLDPRWTGRILQDDPRQPGAGNVIFSAMEEKLGPDFTAAYGRQHQVFDRDLKNGAARVARGEFPVYASEAFPFFLDMNGLPVRFVVPIEGAPYIEVVCSILKGAPHPNAARLFINDFIGSETQTLYGNAGQIPVIAGVADRVRPEVRDMVSARLLGTTHADTVAAMLARAKAVFQ